jgi:hypothetical protein
MVETGTSNEHYFHSGERARRYEDIHFRDIREQCQSGREYCSKYNHQRNSVQHGADEEKDQDCNRWQNTPDHACNDLANKIDLVDAIVAVTWASGLAMAPDSMVDVKQPAIEEAGEWIIFEIGETQRDEVGVV